jgi:hypothetical protein
MTFAVRKKLIHQQGQRAGEGDRAVTSRMSSELANRFVHVIFEPDLDDWSRWAMGPGDLRPEVVAFLCWRPELLHHTNRLMS